MADDDTLAREKAEIAARLKKVCSFLSEEDFEELVHKIALSAVKRRAFGPIPTKTLSSHPMI